MCNIGYVYMYMYIYITAIANSLELIHLQLIDTIPYLLREIAQLYYSSNNNFKIQLTCIFLLTK